MAAARGGMISVSLRNVFKGSIALLGLGAGAAVLADYGMAEDISPQDEEAMERIKIQLHEKLPSRQERVDQMLEGTNDNPFDIFIIGGGATGTGCAVDAATRYSNSSLFAIIHCGKQWMGANWLCCQLQRGVALE